MLVLLSPAKSLNLEPSKFVDYTQALFPKEQHKLVQIMSKKSKKKLMDLMHISEKIAALNVDRYKNFEEEHNIENSKQAIFAFDGDVYKGLKAEELNKSQIKFAQKSVRILSGLYGLLRPLDLIQPYRLEMGTKLKYRTKKNLYEMWGDKIADQIKVDMKAGKHEALINLASQEYFKAAKAKTLDHPIYNINFKEDRNGKLTFVSFNAKKARGFMTRYIIDNKLKQPQDLLAFDRESYKYEASVSDEFNYTFIR